MSKLLLPTASAVVLIAAPAVGGQSNQQKNTTQSIVFRECEGVDGCGTWKFTNKRDKDNYLLGSGVSHSGERTSLLLKFKADNRTVVIVRTNPDTNETVEYAGTEDEDGIAGKFHSDDKTKSGNWYAQPIKLTDRPEKIKYCGPMACHDLVLKNDDYISVDGNGSPSGTQWTVKQFSAEGVQIERQDPGPNGYRATLTGKILASGERIEGEQLGSFGPEKVQFVMTWGSSYKDAHPTGNNQPGHYSMQPVSARDEIGLWTQLLRLLNNAIESN